MMKALEKGLLIGFFAFFILFSVGQVFAGDHCSTCPSGFDITEALGSAEGAVCGKYWDTPPSTPQHCPSGTKELHNGPWSFGGLYLECSCPAEKELITKDKLTSDINIKESSPLYSTGEAMEGVCKALYTKKQKSGLTAGEEALLANCNNLISESSTSAKVDGLQQISPLALKSQQTTTKQVGTFHMGSIANRLLALRESTKEMQKDMSMYNKVQASNHLLADNTFAKPYNKSGGSAGDFEEDEQRRGVFVNATGSTGERDQSAMTAGYNYDGFNLTAGGDYLFDSGIVLGGSIGFGSTHSDLDDDSGTIDSEIMMFSLYGLRDFAAFYLDGVVGLGFGNYDNDRYQDFTVNRKHLQQTLKGDTDGNLFFASFGGGKMFSYRSFTLDFSGRLSYLLATINRYAETTDNAYGAGLALEIDDQDITSLTSQFGVRAGYPFSLSFGVVQPEISFDYVHEFEDSDDIRARFLHDPYSEGFVQTSTDFGETIPTIFSVPTETRDTDYANLGFGLNFILSQSQSVMLNVNTMLFYENYTHWYYTVGYRKDF